MSEEVGRSPRSVRSLEPDPDSFVWACGRHNPQSKRVCHLKGLLDLPICIVRDHEDVLPFPETPEEPMPLDNVPNPVWRKEYARIAVGSVPLFKPTFQQPSVDTISSLRYFTGLQNFSVRQRPFMNAFRRRLSNRHMKVKRRCLSEERGSFNLGANPQDPRTEIFRSLWHKQLREITGTVIDHLNVARCKEQEPALRHPAEWINSGQDPRQSVYSSKTGRLIETTKSRRSRAANPTPMCELSTAKIATRLDMSEDNYTKAEVQIFFMICGILQTNDSAAVQHWLNTASDREKQLIMDILYTAMANRASYYDYRPRFENKMQKQPVPVESAVCEETIGASNTADRL
ncbi:hypothetical protein Ciccas_011621, partial [Cichlidogyrus casuarinus]